MKSILYSALAVLVVCLPFLAAPDVSRAADHSNLEENLPTRVEDAYPIAYKGREIQTEATYEQTEDREDRLILRPILEYGAFKNGQVKLAAPFYAGSADRTDSENIDVEGFYNLWTEPLLWPALSISAQAEFPTGKDAHGVDTEVKLIATKSLGRTSFLNRIHLNGAWKNNAERQEGERSNHYEFVGGYNFRAGPDTTIVVDYVWEEAKEREIEEELIEAGLRRQITPLTVVALGAGAGLTSESPDYRVTLAFQHELSLVYKK